MVQRAAEHRHGEGISVATDTRYDRQRAELGCVFCQGQYIFVTNAVPSVRAKLGRCLRYCGRNVAAEGDM